MEGVATFDKIIQINKTLHSNTDEGFASQAVVIRR